MSQINMIFSLNASRSIIFMILIGVIEMIDIYFLHIVYMSHLIDTLIISGGGAKSVSVLGSLKYLEDKLIIKNIRRYAGSSAGAILCLLLNIGYSAQEIRDSFFSQDSSLINDPFYKKPFNIFYYYGINSGNKLVEYIKQLLVNKGFDKDITFDDLKNKTNKILVMTGTSLTDQNTYYFNYKTTPNMKVVDALRISISIPIFFTSVNYKIKDTEHIFIDGGILENFPIHYFETCDEIGDFVLTSNDLEKFKCNQTGPHCYDNVLGIMLFMDGEKRDVDNFNENKIVINNMGDFFSSYVNTMFLKIEIGNFRDHTGSKTRFFDRVISIVIPKTVSYIDFNLTRKVQDNLINIGKTAIEDFFKTV
jgi:NTE family protein